MSNYVRVSISANELKKSVKDYIGTKVPAISKEPQLRTDLARLYGEVVTPYVPRSAISDAHHHLQTFQVSDGRVTWSRIARSGPLEGEEIAGLLYEGPIRGQFRSRLNGGNQYGVHQPQAEWDKMVKPGTDAWNTQFIPEATYIIIRYFTEKGDW